MLADPCERFALELPVFAREPETFELVKARYHEPHRRYHDWSHIAQLLVLFEETEKSIRDRAAVLYAIFYHDAVYNVTSASNEADSADLFAADSRNIEDEGLIKKVRAFILATRNHEVTGLADEAAKADCVSFLDIDMSILGSSPDEYEVYRRAIRDEYSIFPDEIYNAGRLRVLESFLARPTIYLSPLFRAHLEARARDNVAAEIDSLRAKAKRGALT
jgi:predicted metal-dependent HD superfamily phosphohydrolase